MNGPSPERTAVPWYRRRRVLIVAAALVIAAVTVVTDLPQSASQGVQVRGDSAVVAEVNGYTASCRYALRESFTILRREEAGDLSARYRSLVPSMLTDDAEACSFTSESIDDLSEVEVPEGGAGKDLQGMVDTVLLWTTSPALAAIEAISTLSDSPHDARAAEKLRRAERALTRYRNTALRQLAAADRVLHVRLEHLLLPSPPAG